MTDRLFQRGLDYEKKRARIRRYIMRGEWRFVRSIEFHFDGWCDG